MSERIICAANHYDDGAEHVHQPVNIKTGYVVCGQRHHNCIYTFSLIQKDVDREDIVKLMRTCVQGFITTENRFVDRKEGAEIAHRENQIKDYGRANPFVLYSEDLY